MKSTGRHLTTKGYPDPASAARAFDRLALETRGGMAHTNFHPRDYLHEDGSFKAEPNEEDEKREE